MPIKRKLLIPHMSDHAHALAAAFRAFEVDAEVLPLPDAKSVRLGLQKIAGQECLPCSMVTGDMLEYLRNHNGDFSRYAFFMISGDGPCRLGQYPYAQRAVLDQEGYHDVAIFDASQDQDFYDKFGTLKSSFKRLAWNGFLAIDLLYRKYREVRAYADDRATCDHIYQKSLSELAKTIESRKDISLTLQQSFFDFERIRNHTGNGKVKIAVLGENYIRCNHYANDFLAEKLEDMGAEVLLPSLYEWVFYTNWSARLHCLYEKQYRKYIELQIINALQRISAFRLERKVKGKSGNLKEPSIREIFEMSLPYIPKTFEGETIIEIGRTLDFAKKGASGILRVVPFGCIVGTVVETISEKLSRDLNDMPILTLYFDGMGDSIRSKQLESFLVQARNWNEDQKRR